MFSLTFFFGHRFCMRCAGLVDIDVFFSQLLRVVLSFGVAVLNFRVTVLSRYDGHLLLRWHVLAGLPLADVACYGAFQSNFPAAAATWGTSFGAFTWHHVDYIRRSWLHGSGDGDDSIWWWLPSPFKGVLLPPQPFLDLMVGPQWMLVGCWFGWRQGSQLEAQLGEALAEYGIPHLVQRFLSTGGRRVEPRQELLSGRSYFFRTRWSTGESSCDLHQVRVLLH